MLIVFKSFYTLLATRVHHHIITYSVSPKALYCVGVSMIRYAFSRALFRLCCAPAIEYLPDQHLNVGSLEVLQEGGCFTFL